ncbi:MAG TPA: Uma2 family endonuclease [Chloroflexota bacterium]|nr:Uma2 family endonuclease [Chloroflexota bacterium]
MASHTLLSLADFDALPPREGWKVELNQGELVMTASPRPSHSVIRDRLGVSLTTFASTRILGQVLWETEVALSADSVRIPDLAFISAGRWSQLDPDQRIEGAPDLAIEVVSPSNGAADIALKVQQFLRSGAQAVWVVYPKPRLVYTYAPGERPEILEPPQSLAAHALLPGWSMPLAQLFA